MREFPKSQRRIFSPPVIFVMLTLPLMVSFQNCGKSVVLPTDSATESGDPTVPPNAGELAAQGKILYANNCAACHSSIDTSTKANRSASLITLAISSVPQMSGLISLTPAQIQAISAALSPSSPIVQGPQLFACTPGQQSKSPLLKLTNREYRNSLNSILDGFSTTLKSNAQLITLLDNMPTDTVTSDRNTRKEQAQFINSALALGLFEAAYHAGSLVAGNAAGLQAYPNTSQCLAAATVTQACHQTFVRELASRAFRKPISVAEGNTLAATMWDASLTKTELIQTTFATMLTLPDFIYKTFDTGVATSLGPNVLSLNAHELAAKVSYFLTGAPPDATLRGLADNGTIKTPAVLNAQIDRLIALPAAQDTIRRLFRESYGYDVYDSFNYSAAFLNGQSLTGLQSAMTLELDEYFANVVLNQRGSFRSVMTSTSTRLSNANLASVYGVNQNVTDLPMERAGFLNRAAMLSKRSGNYASPIKRGLDVLEHVLCTEVGPPPPSAPTSLPQVVGEILSTRDKTMRTTEANGTSCTVCHSKFNPLGYTFDKFDSLGRVRTTEAIYDANGNFVSNVAIRTDSSSLELGSQSVTMRDSADLADDIGLSNKAIMCFAKHIKRFESRTVPSAADGCVMNSSLTALYGSNGTQGSVVQALKNYILSDEFSRWSY